MSTVATHHEDLGIPLPAAQVGFVGLLDHPRTPYWILPLLCVFLFLQGITVGDLYRTESLRALIAQGFLESGNWIVPTLYGEPLLTKPPGMYAAIALVSAPLGGVTPWSARLPSVLAASAIVFLFYRVFRRLLGQRAGLVGACIIPTSLMWLDKATTAEIDMLQVFWVAGALLAFLRAVEAEESGERAAHWWLAALLCVAGGTLTKWTAPAFFYLTAIPFLWIRRRLGLLFGRAHLLALAGCVGICFLWATLAIQQAGWDTFSQTVSQEALQRLVPYEVPVAAPRHHHRPYPWLEVLGHPFVIFAGCLPWSLFALVTLSPGFVAPGGERGRRLHQFLHCWLWPNLLFWTLIPEHAPRHSFPFCPAIAGLSTLVWLGWLSGQRPWVWERCRPAQLFSLILLLWLTIKVGFVHLVIPARAAHREPHAKGQRLAQFVPYGETLWLLDWKDEGVLFSYGRTHAPGFPDRVVRRIPTWEDAALSQAPGYVITTENAWAKAPQPGFEVLLRLPDPQGGPILLVRRRLQGPLEDETSP